jgi:Zn-dependent protease/CBS domain-containing protein
MFRSYRVGTIYGIPFKLDVTFLLILPVFTWLLAGQIEMVVEVLNQTFGTEIDPAPLTAGIRPFLVGLLIAVLLFASVTLHELGHSVTAISFGYEVESITLWLLGGIAKPAELPKDWREEFWIAVAGPVVNLGIIAVCATFLVLVPPTDLGVFLLLYLGVLNAGLATFNMLPAFPLDGGRVLRALLARNRSYVRATRQAATVGKGFAFLLGIVGLVTFRFLLAGIALFVYVAATSETKQMLLDAAFEGVAVEEVMTDADELVTVDADLSVTELLDVMFEERHTGYPVIDGDAFAGIVTLEDVRSSEDSDVRVADVMTPLEELQTCRPDSEVMEAFRTLGDNEVGRLPVVEDGDLRGILTRTDLMRAFKIVTQQRRFKQERVRPAPIEGRSGSRRSTEQVDGPRDTEPRIERPERGPDSESVADE